MGLHESSVNFRNLIRDLAEMYPFEPAEVVVVELVANALDAKATRISISYDGREKVLVVEDNGNGMTASQFEEYHDFAAGFKARGTGIGFAGLGAKVSFNIADRVMTETRSKSFSRGSDWYLKSKKKLVWEDIEPVRLPRLGTLVEVRFRPSIKPPFSSREGLIKLLRRHYLPLFDSKFLNLYEELDLYVRKLRFVVNGHAVEPGRIKEDLALDNFKEFFPKTRNKRFGYGVLGVAHSEYPVAPDVCGVFLCTYGKVIKADLFNQFPGSVGPRIFGMVEIPGFVKFLTTAKTDFMRKGKYKEFERLYDPIRQNFKDWLRDIGLEAVEILGTDEARKLERELKKILEDVPELSDFFGFRTKKKVLREDPAGSDVASGHEGAQITFPDGEGATAGGEGPVDTGDEPGQSLEKDQEGDKRARPISRKARRGPKVAFAEAPDRVDLAWVEGNNVVINTGHPSYRKARSNARARRLHSLFAIAGAVQRFLGSESESPDMMFIDRMMAAWGQK